MWPQDHAATGTAIAMLRTRRTMSEVLSYVGNWR